MSKRLSLLLIFLFSAAWTYAIIPTGNVQQTQYRWRNDNGSQTSATWMAALNTPVSLSDTVTVLRLRLELRNNSGTAYNVDQGLEYSSDAGTTWTAITNSATNAFTFQTSTLVADATPTTNQMGSATAGTFVAGRVITTPAASISLANNRKTEYEWIIKANANTLPLTTYLFRSANQGSTPVNYGKLNTTACLNIRSGTVVAAVPAVDCHSTTTLDLDGNTAGAGITYQWQYNTGTGWTDFGAGTETITTPYIIQNTDFRCIVGCGNVVKNDTTESVTVASLPLQVDLGDNIDVCVDAGSGIVLDAGVFPNNPNYAWNDGTTGQVKNVSVSGMYSVRVTDEFTCSGKDSVEVRIKHNPVVHLGNDTTICNGSSLVLDAGKDGIQYFWNTGAIVQKITINAAGSYNVFVTNDQGCTVSDTIAVAMSGELPKIDGISITNNGAYTFHYTAVNPQYVIGYDWDFGDGSPHSYQVSPQHTYATAGNYIVVLKLTSTCGFATDSVSAHMVGIDQITVDAGTLMIYPNPARDIATITNHGDFKMEQVVIYNLMGQVVYRAAADSKDKHDLQLNSLANGSYLVQIITDKGNIARKLELLR